MVQQHVLLADRREDVALEVLNPLGHARGEWRPEQVGARRAAEFRKVGQAENSRHVDHLVVAHAQCAHDQLAQVGRSARGHLEPDDLAAAAALQRGLEFAHEVLGFLLDLEVAVTQHAEGAEAEPGVAGEQPVEEDLEEPLERKIPDLSLGPGREAHHARDLVRHRQQRLEHRVVLFAAQLQAHRKAAVGDEGERMRRVDGEGRQDREDLLEEVAFQGLHVRDPQVAGPEDIDAFRTKQLAQDRPAVLLAQHERAGVGVYSAQLLGRRQPIGAMRGDAFAQQAAQAGDADRIELVEVRARDRQEPDPLQQRRGRVLRLGHHSPVEREPAQLAIDEAVGSGRIEVGQGARARDRRREKVGVHGGGDGGIGHGSAP